MLIGWGKQNPSTETLRERENLRVIKHISPPTLMWVESLKLEFDYNINFNLPARHNAVLFVKIAKHKQKGEREREREKKKKMFLSSQWPRVYILYYYTWKWIYINISPNNNNCCRSTVRYVFALSFSLAIYLFIYLLVSSLMSVCLYPTKTYSIAINSFE